MAAFFNRRQTESEEEAEISQIESSEAAKPGFDTVLGAGCSMEGKVISSGNVRLDGTFNGTLEITGNILVGETAKIDADIDARNISIAGTVRGNVSGNKVQILRTGRVWGDISATALTTEEGAFIDGKITMMRHDAAREVNAEAVTDDQSEPASTLEDTPPTPEEAAPGDDTTLESSDD